MTADSESEMFQLVEIYSGETTTATVLQEMLNERGIPSILRAGEPLGALVAEQAVPPYSKVLISERDYETHQPQLEEIFSLLESSEDVPSE